MSQCGAQLTLSGCGNPTHGLTHIGDCWWKFPKKYTNLSHHPIIITIIIIIPTTSAKTNNWLTISQHFPTHWIAWTIFRIFLWDFRIWYGQVQKSIDPMSTVFSSEGSSASETAPTSAAALAAFSRPNWDTSARKMTNTSGPRPAVWSFYESLVDFVIFDCVWLISSGICFFFNFKWLNPSSCLRWC